VVAVCARSVALADEWMSRPARCGPESFLTAAELEQDEPSRLFLDRDVRYGRVMLANLHALPWAERLERIWHLAFPPAEFMRGMAGRSRAPLPWLYARRGVRGIRRLFMRAASTRL
jgi:hypothetical protein